MLGEGVPEGLAERVSQGVGGSEVRDCGLLDDGAVLEDRHAVGDP
jgi:hypothetical protein